MAEAQDQEENSPWETRAIYSHQLPSTYYQRPVAESSEENPKDVVWRGI